TREPHDVRRADGDRERGAADRREPQAAPPAHGIEIARRTIGRPGRNVARHWLLKYPIFNYPLTRSSNDEIPRLLRTEAPRPRGPPAGPWGRRGARRAAAPTP